MTELGSFLFIDSASNLLGPEMTANSLVWGTTRLALLNTCKQCTDIINLFWRSFQTLSMVLVTDLIHYS